MSDTTEDIAALQTSIQTLSTQTLSLLAEYTNLKNASLQALNAVSNGDAEFAVAAYQSAEAAAATLETVIENTNTALQAASDALTAAQEINAIKDSIIYWE